MQQHTGVAHYYLSLTLSLSFSFRFFPLFFFLMTPLHIAIYAQRRHNVHFDIRLRDPPARSVRMNYFITVILATSLCDFLQRFPPG